MDMGILLQNLINGFSVGSLYALIAIGYTMVYGIVRLINFAHGDIIMLSTYFVYFGFGLFHLPWWLAAITSIVLTAILGVVIEKAAYKPLRNAPRISVLISAIGVSFLLENLSIVIFGGRPQRFFTPPFAEVLLKGGAGGEITIPLLSIIIPIVTAGLMALLMYIVNKTKTGMAMRACSKDVATASLMGINVNRVISTTFCIGSAMAAVGGILWGLKYPQIHPLIGVMPGLKCFIAAVLGGIGNIPGAMLGGLVLGIAEVMLVGTMPSLSGYRDAFAFLILIVILLVRPTGLLGEKVAEKV